MYFPESTQTLEQFYASSKKKKPFKIVEMKHNNFISTKALETHKQEDQRSLKYSGCCTIKVILSQCSSNPPMSQSFLQKSISARGHPKIIQTLKYLEILFPERRKTAVRKKDILCLLEYFPLIHHPIYQQLSLLQCEKPTRWCN